MKKITRRITKRMTTFFITQKMSSYDSNFIRGCLKCQEEYPQLTTRQWNTVKGILTKYNFKEFRNGKIINSRN